MQIFKRIQYEKKCPDCGKRLFKVVGDGNADIIAYCRHCKAEKEVPVRPGENKKQT